MRLALTYREETSLVFCWLRTGSSPIEVLQTRVRCNDNRLYYTVLYFAMPCYAIYAILGYAMLAVLWYDILCYAIRHSMLCYRIDSVL